MGIRVVKGLCSPARGFADDLTLVRETPGGISRLLQAVSDFCRWPGMRTKLAWGPGGAPDERDPVPWERLRAPHPHPGG